MVMMSTFKFYRQLASSVYKKASRKVWPLL